jgi:hypothetical protein
VRRNIGVGSRARRVRVLTATRKRSSDMNRILATLTGAALATAFLVAPAAAQNLPPPGNVNPGSLNSGAEESGAENQPRSYAPGYAPYVVSPRGYDAYATPYGAMGPRSRTGLGYQSEPGYGPFGLGTGGANAIGADD